ncbi:right-handed parallel beta-helix repeat-containing protein [Pseudoduganella sp. UC29_106]|uniref:right-handed parallel beta-helix repeat-containing protein n=1 Tax=Pseudoduganella sp. UC29_106 TaxID=3374553 RepID=UPI003757DE71
MIVENSEIYNVDGIGLATRSAWMCRPNGAPCGDYPPYKGNPALLAEQASTAASEYYPSTKLIFRNNKIHNVGGDGIVLRTAAGAKIESNLLYDIWMRAPGNSAGAWAINTDDAEFAFNEIHSTRLREHIEPGDGMAFDADMGTRNTRFYANYSHDNAGGMMLFCGCGNDGLGHPATASGTVVERNLSLNDGRRIIAMAGSESALVKGNLIVTDKPGLVAPLLENLQFPTKNAVELRGNLFIHAAGQGSRFRTKNPQGGDADIVWGPNEFQGFGEAAPVGQDATNHIAKWMVDTGFSSRRYAPRK